jgi:hypothetical protein
MAELSRIDREAAPLKIREPVDFRTGSLRLAILRDHSG